MRARLSLPALLPTLARRIAGCTLGLALGLAVAASPAVSAPHRAGPGRATKTATKTTSRGAKSRTRKAKGGSSKAASGSASRKRAAARAAEAARAVAPPSLPELPQVDLGAFAALTAAELTPTAAGPAGAEAAALAELPQPFAAFSRSATAMLDALTERARSQLGTRYVLGAASPGGALDCSAFTRFAMEALGLRLPRTAAQQAKVGVAVPRDRNSLRPGDLLTFGRGRKVSHVGIYLGEGRFIHASVKSGQVIETTFAKNALLLRRWLGARRLLADADSTPARGG